MVRSGVVRYILVYTVPCNSVFRQMKGVERRQKYACVNSNKIRTPALAPSWMCSNCLYFCGPPHKNASFFSGLLECKVHRLQRLWQRRAVEYCQRRSRSTFLLLTLLTTCLPQQCTARPRQLWTEIRSDCCAIVYFLLTTLDPFSLLSYGSKTWWECVVL